MSLFPNSSPTIIGIDIGEQSLKVAVLRTHTTWRGSRTIELLLLKEYAMPPGIIVHGELPDVRALTQFLSQISTDLRTHGIKTMEAIIGIAESQSFLLTEPAGTTHEDMRALMVREIPFSPEELYADSQCTQSYRVLGAAPKQYIDNLMAAAEGAGFTIAGLDLEGLATVRAVTFAAPKETTGSWGLIDFGATRTQWMLADHDVIRATLRLPMSGAALTASMVETLHLSPEQAERTKRECGIDPERCKGSLSELLVPQFETLAKRIREAVGLDSTVMLVGGGARMPGLASFLESTLHVKTIIPPLIDPFTRNAQTTLADNPLGFATAIGLALRTMLV